MNGPPDHQGWAWLREPGSGIRDGKGRFVRVQLWCAAEIPPEPDVWWAWLFIEGHPSFDPVRHVLGGCALQATGLAWRELHRYVDGFEGYLCSTKHPIEREPRA